MDNRYWAAKKPPELLPEMYSRIELYFQELQSTGHLYKMRKSYEIYYNLTNNSAFVGQDGDQGELLKIATNHYKSIINQIHTMVTKDRPSLAAQAINSDYKSQSQTILANGLLDYYIRTRDFEHVFKEAAELGITLSRGFVVMRWNPNKGKEYGTHPDTGAVIYDGDIEAVAKSPFEMVQDIHAEDQSWYVIIEYKNKYDLAAQYLEKEDEIVGLSDDNYEFRLEKEWALNRALYSESDLIPHYTFVHEPTPALPNGRQVEFLDDDIWLTDGPLPYREIPVIPIQPGKVHGKQLGDTPAFSMLAIQESIDELVSTILTNQSTFGVQNVLVPRGANVDVQQLEGGLNLIEYDPNDGEIAPLNLTNTPGEVFQFIEKLRQDMQLLSGVNDVVRGVAPQNLRSGSALALLASQALQSQSGLNHSYTKLLERAGSAIIHLLQDYARTPRVAMIAGKSQRSEMREFTSDDIEGVDRVVVEQQSSLMRTTAGRLELAQNLLQNGLIFRPEEYVSIVETGQMQSMLGGQQSELLLIRKENEALREGEYTPIIYTDAHDLHIRSHKEVLADPEVRKDPVAVRTVLTHIQEHIDALKNTDPHLLSVIKEQPIQQQPAQQPASPSDVMTPQAPADPNIPNQPNLPDQAPLEAQDAYNQMELGEDNND